MHEDKKRVGEVERKNKEQAIIKKRSREGRKECLSKGSTFFIS